MKLSPCHQSETFTGEVLRDEATVLMWLKTEHFSALKVIMNTVASWINVKSSDI